MNKLVKFALGLEKYQLLFFLYLELPWAYNSFMGRLGRKSMGAGAGRSKPCKYEGWVAKALCRARGPAGGWSPPECFRGLYTFSNTLFLAARLSWRGGAELSPISSWKEGGSDPLTYVLPK